MIHLHERLSEFSYGYGVTKEAEGLLSSIGLHGAPFLPSLSHEGTIGYDVKLNGPGRAILLQFKLGQQLQRFYRRAPLYVAPPVSRPFWRFEINTWQPAGQYQLLLAAEQAASEVYYVAPRFAEWNIYAAAYDAQEIIANSLLVRPSEIEAQLTAKGAAPGRHLVVYDRRRSYVCSMPTRLNETTVDDLVTNWTQAATARSERTLRQQVEGLLASLDNADARAVEVGSVTKEARGDFDQADIRAERESATLRRIERKDRIEQLQERGRTREQAEAITVGLEYWARGAQLILMGEPEESS